MELFNLGCGSRYAKGWRNLDFIPTGLGVERHNLLDELPCADTSVDAIYSSHVLEHFTPEQARIFILNCYRKLKNNGVLRIVVPDLENICREYLKSLDSVRSGDVNALDMHRWMIIELLDQMVRIRPGGAMADFWSDALQRNNVSLVDYIRHRTGRNLYQNGGNGTAVKSSLLSFQRLRQLLITAYLRGIRLLIPTSIRNCMIDNSPIGEKHRWMYDRVSLQYLLESVGFKDVKFLSPSESSIPDFFNYCLDTEKDGTPYKRSSIYCEAVK